MEVNTNPTKILDHCMIVKVMFGKGAHPRPKRTRIRLSRENARHLQTTFSGLEGILWTPWTSGRKMGARDWRFLFVGLVWEGGGTPCDVVVFQKYALTEPLF